ncbi:hypothetical protein OS123_03565 [Corynebacterium sp. P5875]|uniref:Uncharacterized protein n=1 Tax=Corynebacterium antarcticum TaxID=2800405 RepID=A0A9Q4CBY3_9CORY|nr:hypothetical protein [Corynebacterium antarcticum]MCX7537628.1 hypothetical protein [Corynebacterium antarcticum]
MTDNQDYQWDSSDDPDDWGPLPPPQSAPEPETTAWTGRPGVPPQSAGTPTGRRPTTVPVLLGVAVLAAVTTALAIHLLSGPGGGTPDGEVVAQTQPVSAAPATDAAAENARQGSAATSSSRATTSAAPVVRTAVPHRDYPSQFTGRGWDLRAANLIAACNSGEDAVLAARNDSVFVTICRDGYGYTYHGFVTGTGALDRHVEESGSDPDLHRYVVDTGDAEITVTPTRLTVYIGDSLEMDETFDEWWVDVN